MSELSEALRLFITNTARRSCLDVGGEIDLATVDALGDHLALLVESGTGDIEVGMADVIFCDATVLRVLLGAHQTLDAGGRDIRIINPSAPTVRLLQLAGLDTVLLAPPHREPQHRAHLGKRACRALRAPTGADGRTWRKEPGMPIDKRVNGLSADVTLRRAATNGERHVAVVGDFNDWSPHGHPMIGGLGGWSCTLTVAVGRRYRFRYLLDGERWENDWEADDYVDNDYGGQDSVIDV